MKFCLKISMPSVIKGRHVTSPIRPYILNWFINMFRLQGNLGKKKQKKNPIKVKKKKKKKKIQSKGIRYGGVYNFLLKAIIAATF